MGDIGFLLTVFRIIQITIVISLLLIVGGIGFCIGYYMQPQQKNITSPNAAKISLLAETTKNGCLG